MLKPLIVSAGLLMALPALAQSATAITGLRAEIKSDDSEAITFLGNAPLNPHKTFVLSDPYRVVVDVDRIEAARLALPKNYAGGLVKAARFGQFNPTTSRIVLDLTAPATVTQGEAVGTSFVLTITPATISGGARKINAKPLIVIDAGHGGQDPGALGLHKTYEKEVTLNYARYLRQALLKTGRYRVALTRDDDRFILLPDRVAIARKLKADLFISLHADSNPRAEAQGLSIYTLSETASDDEAAALAEHENKSDIIPGIDLNTTDADVASILIDLTQRETMNKSALLADAVVDSLHGKITRLPRPHRFAGFRVLKAPDIPSVLIEIGFLSNVTDERLLLSPEYRTLVIGSIVKGIDRFRAGE
ncbi:MAG: N-acetylmuramoyl-L-alanine amidase [Alphaproteobacteria bacterium]|nr:N-acetylmuramoyl-L-alanine amidase [Alphaproteobacteria bacterium]